MSSNDRLGRGLGALLGEYMQEPMAPGTELVPPTTLPVRTIVPNPFQPRVAFDPDELADLANSIRASGLLQPIVVRPSPKGSTYELVAGERRLRAVRELGWTEVPAQIREVDDRTLLVLALVENIQREALGPLEEARGYGVLRDEFGLTQAEIAEVVGKNRSTVANMLRLLALPPSVRRLVEDGTLTMGHARAILSLNDPIKAADLAKEAVAGSWSVRETEARVRKASGNGNGARAGAKRAPRPRDPAIAALEEALQGELDARATIRSNGSGSGTIQIPFSGPRELERIFAALTGKDAADVVG